MSEPTEEDVLTALYKLASAGASKAFNIDLMALEKLSGESTSVSELCSLAMLGVSNEDEVAFVRACRSVLVRDGEGESSLK